MSEVNWFMVAVGLMQEGAAFYGCFVAGQSWRLNVMNVLVGAANMVLAGAR